jgi:hypothetical protein
MIGGLQAEKRTLRAVGEPQRGLMRYPPVNLESINQEKAT